MFFSLLKFFIVVILFTLSIYNAKAQTAESISCESDNDCIEDFLCNIEKDICKADTSLPVSCQSDNDCDEGKRCISTGKCIEVSGE